MSQGSTGRIARRVGVALLLCCGCGGGGSGPDPDGPVMAKSGGDLQTGPAGTPLPIALRVRITQGGNAVAGRTVTWAVLASGGGLTPASSVTGADGIASTSVILPPFAATSAVSAASSGVGGSPLRFSVTSTGATSQVTVQVANNEFFPETFQLQAGGNVTFIWLSGAGPHNVTPLPPNTQPASTNPAPPGTHDAPYSFTANFPTGGTFGFFCGVHGSPTSGMRGTLTVLP